MALVVLQKNEDMKRTIANRQREKTLSKIIKEVGDSEYGMAIGLDRVKNFVDFQRYIPLVTYEDLEPYIERMLNGHPRILSRSPVVVWASTSGPDSKPKLVPYTESFIRMYKRANFRLFKQIFLHYPEVFLGKILVLAGRGEVGKTPDGLTIGSASGLMLRRLNAPARVILACLGEQADEASDENRFAHIIELSHTQDIRCILTTSPTFIFGLLEQLPETSDASNEELGNTVQKLWPNLRLICCPTGGYAGWHVRQLQSILPNIEIWDTGLGATEGHFTSTLRLPEPVGISNSGEYIIELLEQSSNHGGSSEQTRTIEEAKTGRVYELVISAINGFLRYRIGDLVVPENYGNNRCLRFTGRVTTECSKFGERITNNQLRIAIEHAEVKTGIYIRHLLILEPSPEQKMPWYTLVATPSSPRQLLQQESQIFGHAVDEKLQEININYFNMRKIFSRLKEFLVKFVSLNSYKNIRMGSRVTPLFEGQGKEYYINSGRVGGLENQSRINKIFI